MQTLLINDTYIWVRSMKLQIRCSLFRTNTFRMHRFCNEVRSMITAGPSGFVCVTLSQNSSLTSTVICRHRTGDFPLPPRLTSLHNTSTIYS